MAILDDLQELKTFYCEDRCVLSVYLNTDPSDRDHQSGAWKIELKTGLKRLDEYLKASRDEKEIKAFEKMKEKVVKDIEQNQGNLQKGVVIFASPHNDLWWSRRLQVPVETNFYWETKPELEQLESVVKAYPDAAIILPSYGEIRLLDTALGSVTEELTFEFDPNIDVWHERTGNKSTGSSNNRHPELDARMRENLNRFYKEVASKVESMKKERGWKEIHIIGEAESANTFAESLRQKASSCVYKNLINTEATKVMQEVFQK